MTIKSKEVTTHIIYLTCNVCDATLGLPDPGTVNPYIFTCNICGSSLKTEIYYPQTTYIDRIVS